MALLRGGFLIAIWLAGAAQAEQRLISVGDHRLSIDCTGAPSRSGTVVLIAGQGRTAKDWVKVQPEVSRFARVCSYDRRGLGGSDPAPTLQSVNDIVEDLHQLLPAAGENPPYLLACHSIAGIHCRRYEMKYGGEVSGLVFVDSSHEEQIWRLHEVNPAGPDASVGGDLFLATKQRLEWHTQLPLIVLEHGKDGPPIAGLSKDQNEAFARIWREVQADLAKRSPRGELRIARRSGHYIQVDQPQLVVQAIRDVMRAGA